MGLDIYVGSLTRYYARDWETVLQQHGRESGIPVDIIRPDDTEDAVTDQNRIRAAVLAWRENLSKGLGPSLAVPFDWDESSESPYFTDKPAWDCYSSLLLWAAYSEHSDIVRPIACVEDWTTDEAYRRSTNQGFRTRYPALLRNTEIWLPSDFRFTFAAEDLSGNTVNFGSAVSLRNQLIELNARTWNADNVSLAAWRKEGADYLAPLEVGARFAFALFFDLVHAAVEHKLVMKLDY